MSKATGEKLSIIDAVIWFYGAERPEIKKPICGKLHSATDACSQNTANTINKTKNSKRIEKLNYHKS